MWWFYSWYRCDRVLPRMESFNSSPSSRKYLSFFLASSQLFLYLLSPLYLVALACLGNLLSLQRPLLFHVPPSLAASCLYSTLLPTWWTCTCLLKLSLSIISSMQSFSILQVGLSCHALCPSAPSAPFRLLHFEESLLKVDAVFPVPSMGVFHFFGAMKPFGNLVKPCIPFPNSFKCTK